MSDGGGVSAVVMAMALAFWLSTMTGTTPIMVFVAFVVLEAVHEAIDIARAYLLPWDDAD